MKKIYLLRHAKAVKEAASDFERELSKKGKNDLKKLFENIKIYEIKLDKIIASSAKRTAQTAEIFANLMKFDEKNIILKNEIYEANAKSLFTLLQSLDDDLNEILLVGHNPAMLELCELLSPLCLDRFATSSLLCLQFDITSFKELKEHSGKLVFFEIVRSPKVEI